MADLLNIPNCGGVTSTFNSGDPLCDVIRSKPYMLILLDAGVGFSSAERASVTAFVTALKAKTRAARGSRAYIIKDLTNFEDTSQAPGKAAIGNLSTQQLTITDAIPSFDFQHRKGELFHKQLTAAENASLTLLVVDDKYLVLGTVTSGGLLTGFSLSEFYVGLPKFANASTPANYPFSIALESVTEYKENLGLFQADSTIVGASGINNVALSLVSQAVNVANIKALSTGGKNLGDLYSTELADGALWTATNKQTGADMTITSVTWNAGGYFVVTVDSTEYAALTAADIVEINLASASDLSDAGVDGFESTGPVEIVKA